MKRGSPSKNGGRILFSAINSFRRHVANRVKLRPTDQELKTKIRCFVSSTRSIFFHENRHNIIYFFKNKVLSSLQKHYFGRLGTLF